VVLGLAGGRTEAGNRILVGTDPVLHDGGDYTSPGARGTIIREGIAYAGSHAGTTGMYFDSTCGANYFGQSAETLAIVEALSAGSGSWTIDADPPCGGAVSLIASNPSFADLTTASLQGWGCSVHQAHPTFRSDWSALAVATDTLSAPTCGVDPGTGLGACGEAYILIAGSNIVVNSLVISVSPPDATNPVGTSHTVTANVHAVGGTPVVAGQLVAFSVTGVNAGVSGTCAPVDCTSDAAGDVSFTYFDGGGAGDDTIKASFTDTAGSLQTATAQKHWVGECVTEICDNDIDDDCDGLIDDRDPDCELLSVDLGGFSVTPNDGRVKVDWNTLSESDNAGFYLLRRDVLRGTTARVNQGLIPARGDVYSGAAYQFEDSTAVNGVEYGYALVDVNRLAKETRHPFVSTIANPISPRIKSVSPAFGARLTLGRKTTFTWTPVSLFGASLLISRDATFPADTVLSIGIDARQKAKGSVTLSPRQQATVEQMSSKSAGVLYWKIVERSVGSKSDHSATYRYSYDLSLKNDVRLGARRSAR
jgi:hypothetical protein